MPPGALLHGTERDLPLPRCAELLSLVTLARADGFSFLSKITLSFAACAVNSSTWPNLVSVLFPIRTMRASARAWAPRLSTVRSGFVAIEVRCSVAECLSRNASRSLASRSRAPCSAAVTSDRGVEAVSPDTGYLTSIRPREPPTDETLRRLADRFEAIGAEPWERRHAYHLRTGGRSVKEVVAEAASAVTHPSVWRIVARTLRPPSPDYSGDITGVRRDAQSVVHAVDLQLRALVQRIVALGKFGCDRAPIQAVESYPHHPPPPVALPLSS